MKIWFFLQITGFSLKPPILPLSVANVGLMKNYKLIYHKHIPTQISLERVSRLYSLMSGM
jgi:hypothetical protein